MVRIALSIFASMILLYIESTIVMEWMGYQNGITFENSHGLFVVCILNFFLSFSILTQLTPWFEQWNGAGPNEDEETYSS